MDWLLWFVLDHALWGSNIDNLSWGDVWLPLVY